MANPVMTTFIGGEVSERFRGRIDIPKYYQSCRLLENMVVIPLGGCERRPGTPFVAESKTSDKKVRLIAFEYSTSIKYMLEFGNQYIRVFKDHVQVENGGSPYEVSGSPLYLEAELFDIQKVMIGSEMYLFHPNHAPRKLVRTADNSWTISTLTFTGWDKTTEKTITGITNANPAVVTTSAAHGYSNGDTIRIVGIKGMPEVNCKIYKVAGQTATTFQLLGRNSTDFDPYVSGGTVVKKDQIFDSADDYPSCACVYGGRLIVGATNNDPATYLGSKIGDYTNMIIDNEDDDGFMYEISAIIGTRIMWIVGKTGLIIGTNVGEFVVPGESGYLTPTNALPYPGTRHGSKNLQADLINDTVLFFQRAGKRLREYLFEEAMAGYVANDLTMLADHITGSGIVGFAVQTEPQTILWGWTSDGELITLTYDRQLGIFAWAKQPTDGKVESIDIIPGEAGNEDEIWLSVNRKSYTASKRYIEYFKPRDFGDDQSDCFFIESGVTYDCGTPKNITVATQENPVVITSDSHGFENDQKVKIAATPGMTQLNGKVYTVKGKTATTFQLYTEDGFTAINGTGFDALETVNITGTTKLGSKEVTDLSITDVAKLLPGMYLSGNGVDNGALIVSIDSDNNKFTMSKASDGSLIDTTIGCYGQVKRVVKIVSGLGHLDDKSVSVLADGAAHPDKVVDTGSITLDRYSNKIHAGLPYISKLKPMQIGTPDQLTKISNLWIRFYKTLGCKAGPDENNLETIVFRKATDPMDSPPPLSSEDKKTPGWKGGSENEGNVLVVQDQPLPMTILSLIPEIEVHGG